MWQSMNHSVDPKTHEGELIALRSERADEWQAFVLGKVCVELAEIEIDNKTDCNVISEGLLELLR